MSLVVRRPDFIEDLRELKRRIAELETKLLPTVGPPGADGEGVPTGGSAGQFLRKQSGTNFDTAFAAPTASEVGADPSGSAAAAQAASQPLDSDLTTLAGLARLRGDMIVADGTPAWSKLAIGSANKVLLSDGTDPAWMQLAHNLLSGLTSDDGHTQYALGLGRATPQTLAFGSAASAATGHLTSTSHATKGKYFLDAAHTITVDELNTRLGIGVSSPATALELSGQAARTIQLARHTTAATAGSALTLQSGGAVSGGTNKAAGTLNLSTGLATGSGTGTINLKAPTPGASGTADSTLTTQLAITGSLATFTNRLNLGHGIQANEVFDPSNALMASFRSSTVTVDCVAYDSLPAYTRSGNVLTASASGAFDPTYIDDVVPSVGIRVIVTGAVASSDYGLYSITELGSGGTPWIMTRTYDANSSSELETVWPVVVSGGTFYTLSVFSCDTTVYPITLNTTAISPQPQTLGTPTFYGLNIQGNINIQGNSTLAGETHFTSPDPLVPESQTWFGSGAYLSLASDGYMLATADTAHNAGFTGVRHGDKSGYVSFDLITGASYYTGFSISLVPSNDDLRIVDRAQSSSGAVAIVKQGLNRLDLLDSGQFTQIQLDAQNAKILFGSTQDVNLYRSAADTLKTDDAFIAANLTSAGLTSGRVALVSTSGLLADDADLTFSVDTLTVPKIGTTTMTGTTTHTGSMILKSVTDAGPMTATNGTVGEIVYNTSDSKFYGCTVTGTPATWTALN